MKFAIAYGFRNIQNIVQKIKRGKCPYHFVEVMACPSGKFYQVFEVGRMEEDYDWSSVSW